MALTKHLYAIYTGMPLGVLKRYVDLHVVVSLGACKCKMSQKSRGPPQEFIFKYLTRKIFKIWQEKQTGLVALVIPDIGKYIVFDQISW